MARSLFGLLMLIGLFTGPARAAEELEEAIANDALAPIAWLAGRWVGVGPGGEVEEVWSPPMHGEMFGTFRMYDGGEAVFYEFMTIRVEAGRVVLRLKHFDPDFSGWEMRGESVDFPLVAWGEGGARFDGLHYVRRGGDHVTVQVVTEAGAPPLTFELQRRALEP